MRRTGICTSTGSRSRHRSRSHTIEVAGDTVMIGNQPSTFTMPTQWALVREGRVEPLPASTTWYPRLSTDGRIAYWQTNPTIDTTQFVMWDAVTNQELATQTVHGRFDGAHRLHVIGVDADGIAYWVDEASSDPRHAVGCPRRRRGADRHPL